MKLFIVIVFAFFTGNVHAVDWNFIGPGLSYHATDRGTRSEVIIREGGADIKEIPWSEFNPAVGLEAVFPDTHDWTTRVFGQVVRDSYGSFGLMLGVGRAKYQMRIGSLSVDTGVMGGLWWRQSLAGLEHFRDANDNWGSRVYTERKMVPFVLPMLYVYGQKTGLAFTVIPRMSIGGNVVSTTTTFAVQIFYR